VDITKFDITIDARMINHSGIGTYIKNLIPDLADNYKLAVLGNKNILTTFIWGKKVKIVDANYPIYSISEQLNLPKDIPYCKLFISPHYNIPIRRIPADNRMVVVHDVNHLLDYNKISLIKKMYAKFMISAAVRKSNKVITDSNFSKTEINKYIKTNNKEIKIVYCGIEGEQIAASLNSDILDSIKNKYRLPQKYFLYVGSIKRHKNLLAALKAFNLFNKKYSDFHLVIIGLKYSEFLSEPEFEGLRENVFVPGFIPDDDLPGIYANALSLVFPSYYEGFGLPPLEAMSCGCPVISSNASSLPEVCADAALYFNPNNVDEIVTAMQRIVEDKNIVKELIQKGNENIKRFSRSIFNKNIKKEIDELILN